MKLRHRESVLLRVSTIEVSEFLLHGKNTIFDDLFSKKSLKSMVLSTFNFWGFCGPYRDFLYYSCQTFAELENVFEKLEFHYVIGARMYRRFFCWDGQQFYLVENNPTVAVRSTRELRWEIVGDDL